MSTTKTRLDLAAAEQWAADLWRRCNDCAESWELAGSLRRRESTVGDIEHVVVPRFGQVAAPGLFDATRHGNLLWQRLDELLELGVIEKALRADGRTCWGEKTRALICGGVRHEIYTANRDGLGYVTLIRTGPPEFSKAYVTRLRKHGYEGRDGLIYPQGRQYHAKARSESEALRLAGLGWIEPAKRCAEAVEG